MKKFILFGTLLILSYLAFTVTRGSVTKHADVEIPSMTAQDLAEVELQMKSDTSEQTISRLKNAFLEAQPRSSGKSKALGRLAIGMLSENPAVRSQASVLTRSLLIDFAHSKNPSLERTRELKILFAIFKQRGAEQIAEIQSAHPESKTLEILKNI